MTRSKQATVSDMRNEPGNEIFDDLYLGVRAGGALRKKRRGELLTAEEIEALSRWQRLSAWRKGLAIGGFTAGTFGLGFTLGGLVFGRWRKASLAPASAPFERLEVEAASPSERGAATVALLDEQRRRSRAA